MRIRTGRDDIQSLEESSERRGGATFYPGVQVLRIDAQTIGEFLLAAESVDGGAKSLDVRAVRFHALGVARSVPAAGP